MRRKEAGGAVCTVMRLALAGATAIASMGAWADDSVNIYGTADIWAGSSKELGKGSSQRQLQSGGMQTSYFGLSGSENLGDGLKAVFAIEAFIRMNDGQLGRYDGDDFFSRSAYAGLEGDWGRITLGRTTTPYFISTILFNPLAGSFAFSPAIYYTYMGNGIVEAPLKGDSSWSKSVLYNSPAIGGMTLSLQYARGSAEEAVDLEKENGAQKLGGNVVYEQGPFSATVAMQQLNFSRNAGDLGSDFRNQRALLAGLAYDFSSFKLYGQYQSIQNKYQSAKSRINSAQVGVRVPTSTAGAVLASYAHAKTSGFVSDSRNTWAVAYEHSLSKRTQLYGSYFRDSVRSAGQGSNVGVGIKHTF